MIYCHLRADGQFIKCSPEVPCAGAGMVFCRIAHTGREVCNRCGKVIGLGKDFGFEMTPKGVLPFHRAQNECK